MPVRLYSITAAPRVRRAQTRDFAEALGADGGQVIVLRPDHAWLTDRARVLPITIDPDTYVDNDGQRDTYVVAGYPNTSYGSASMLRVGLDPDAGKARSFIQYKIPSRVGGAVKSATLKLYQYAAGSCTPTTLNIYPATSSWTGQMTWSGTIVGDTKQPSIDTTSPNKASDAFAYGVTGQCANGSQSINVKNLVAAWMTDPTKNFGMALRASETDPSAYKAFCSLNFNGGGTSCNLESRQPTLSITYNTAPSVPFAMEQAPVTCYDGDVPRVTTTTPTLSAIANDADLGGTALLSDGSPNPDYGKEKVRLRFEVWPARATDYLNPNSIPADDPMGALSMISSGYSASVEQGARASWTMLAGSVLLEVNSRSPVEFVAV